MTGQMTIFDFMTKREPLPLGYVKNGEALKGRMIPFRDLAAYVGKRVLLEIVRESAVDYKVILVTNYYQDHDNVYCWKDGKAVMMQVCDRVGYSDDNRTQKCNSWVSEMYCRNGIGKDVMFPECMYELEE